MNIDNVSITRKAIKHIYLRIDADGNVRISVPKKLSNRDIDAFIETKHDWIVKKQQQRLLQKQQLSEKHLKSRDFFTLLGQQHLIQRHYGLRNNIEIIDEICHLTVKNNNEFQKIQNSPIEQYEKIATVEYYRETLKPLLNKWVDHYKPIIGVVPNEIRTKNMKTKWGTCNTRDKRLWFNVQLAKFTEMHIAYVVVHEMVHLLEPSHNKRFYALVEQAMPDWAVYHEALKHEST